MSFTIETVLEVVGELVSEGIDAAITTRQEKKRKIAYAQIDDEFKIEKGEKTDVSEEPNH